jgi:hypothetical protein
MGSAHQPKGRKQNHKGTRYIPYLISKDGKAHSYPLPPKERGEEEEEEVESWQSTENQEPIL